MNACIIPSSVSIQVCIGGFAGHLVVRAIMGFFNQLGLRNQLCRALNEPGEVRKAKLALDAFCTKHSVAEATAVYTIAMQGARHSVGIQWLMFKWLADRAIREVHNIGLVKRTDEEAFSDYVAHIMALIQKRTALPTLYLQDFVSLYSAELDGVLLGRDRNTKTLIEQDFAKYGALLNLD